MNRKEIASLIVKKLQEQESELKLQYEASKDKVGYFYIDNLLPLELAEEITDKFPKIEETVSKKNIREYKHIAYQMNKYHPLLEEVIYAFQEEEVVNQVAKICNVNNVFPDEHLYAGGLSLMAKDNFLNPHLDNSHDKDRNLWRVFNLLYYVTPNWKLENGGNLELWPNGLNKAPFTIESRFNRLAVMATHNNSWHSVSKVEVDAVRRCVSNYYFSEKPLYSKDTFHVTTFRGRPKEKVKDFILRIDNGLRSSLRKIFKRGVNNNSHQYKK